MAGRPPACRARAAAAWTPEWHQQALGRLLRFAAAGRPGGRAVAGLHAISWLS